MTAANIDIRIKLLETGVKIYEIADYLKIYDTALSRLLRYELTPEYREKVMNAIDEIKNRKD